MIFWNVSSEVAMTASASSPPSVTLTLPSSTLTVHLPAPSMSKRYELVMPAVFVASARPSRPSKNSFTPGMGENPTSEVAVDQRVRELPLLLGERHSVVLEPRPVDALVAQALPLGGEAGDLLQQRLDGRARTPAPKAR